MGQILSIVFFFSLLVAMAALLAAGEEAPSGKELDRLAQMIQRVREVGR